MPRTIRLTIDLITDLDPGPAFEAARRAIEDNMTDAEVAAGSARDLTADEPLVDYDLITKEMWI